MRSLLLLLPLAACATSAPIHGPNGQIAHMIQCPGMALTMNACIEKANDLCAAGYSIIDASENGYPVAGMGSGANASYGQGYDANSYGFAGTMVQRQLVVACAK